ncbi:MAG TPA: C45 family autoproteolytic acyltransferase/hydrolase [Clostridia bacterium]|nr:C45 family autoproteolytic acyltransferase/hydrolase [Clostridia bacterium]HPK16722.1 C45 family autoproteolytic acyltransferase/hydrolase [Clostridia bacterium]
MKEFRQIWISGATPFERGADYGRQAAAEIDVCVNTYVDHFKRNYGMNWDTVRALSAKHLPLLDKRTPEQVEEMHGIAQGAGKDPLDILALNCRYELLHYPAMNECTAYALLREATRDGRVYLGQNWDQRPFLLPHCLILHIEEADGMRILGHTEAGQLIRNGINSHGLGFCANSLRSSADGRGEGIPANFLRRRLLTCTRFDEMLDMLVGAERAISNNYCLASAENKAADVEGIPGHTAVLRPENGVITHANHILSKPELDTTKGGKFRGERLAALLCVKAGDITKGYLKECLKDHFGYPESICSHVEESENDIGKLWQTNASIIYDLDALELDICYGPPCSGEYKTYKL